jgi:uncharacterized damage-inducible protein DinB
MLATVKDEFTRYFRHLAERVDRAVRSVPLDKVWVKPFAFGNSLGHLVLHLTGNLNHYIGAGIAKTGYQRDRPKEFTDPAHPPPAEALKRFHAAVDMVCRTIEGMDEQSMQGDIPDPDRHPIQTRFGLLLVCAAHMNNHVGQMAYLVQAHGCSTQEKPVW